MVEITKGVLEQDFIVDKQLDAVEKSVVNNLIILKIREEKFLKHIRIIVKKNP